MHTKTLGLIHTSATLVPGFAELCANYLPGIKTFNIVDDSLIKNTIPPSHARKYNTFS